MPEFDFSKLPVILQYFAMIGAVLGGIWMMVRGNFAAKTQAPPEVRAVDEVAHLAAQLADAKLRQEIDTVLHSMREAIYVKIDGVVTDIRTDHRAAFEESREDRRVLYKILAALDGRIHELELEFARFRNGRR